jgi:molybdopterin-guanine dinucleotide biosynthesis protein A
MIDRVIQALIGLWPVSCTAALSAFLNANYRVQDWIAEADAIRVRERVLMRNIDFANQLRQGPPG